MPGGDAENVISGIDFIRGVHLRDEKALKGRVVVVGGGNIAADVAPPPCAAARRALTSTA